MKDAIQIIVNVIVLAFFFVFILFVLTFPNDNFKKTISGTVVEKQMLPILFGERLFEKDQNYIIFIKNKDDIYNISLKTYGEYSQIIIGENKSFVCEYNDFLLKGYCIIEDGENK